MSAYLNQFSIPFVSLNEGVHHYSFDITDKFFENFELSEITKGKLQVDLELNRQTTHMILNFNIEGAVTVACDICLDDMSLPVHSSHSLYIKFGDSYKEETDEVIYIPHSSSEVEIAQFIYEFIHLALPIRKEHPLDENNKSTCNEAMLKHLEKMQKNNSDNNTWDALKNLNIN